MRRSQTVTSPPSGEPHPLADRSFLRLPGVMRLTGLGRSTIYRLIADQQFPGPVRLGPRAVAWRREDLQRWSDSRPPTAH